VKFLFVVAVTISLVACTASTPTMQKGDAAEVTFDGLYRVDGTRMDETWLRPDIDLSQYGALMFEGAGVSYMPVKQRARYASTAEKFPLDDRQRARLEATITEVLVEEFGQFEHYSVTDQAGPGVLKVTIGLKDVLSRVPPERNGSRVSFYLRDLGEATLVLEVRDAETNQILARVVDRAGVENTSLQESNAVTNINEVKRSVRRWGKSIRQGLDGLHQAGCYFCENPG